MRTIKNLMVDLGVNVHLTFPIGLETLVKRFGHANDQTDDNSTRFLLPNVNNRI